MGTGNGRYYGEAIKLGKGSVEEFFDKRPQKQVAHRYNYVIFQDNNPELALKRDAYEKNMVLPYLRIKDGTRVLDIGCGVGRWGDELSKYDIAQYVGIDFSEPLLRIAREVFAEDSRFSYLLGSFQDIDQVLDEHGCPSGFDIVLVNGVFMYINDDEIDRCLSAASKLLNRGGRLYIKESVGATLRFTLKDYESEELGPYSTIYRSVTEWKALIETHFPEGAFRVIVGKPTWPEDMENRVESLSYFWIIVKL